MNKYYVMTDIETLATSADAVVLEIGAVLFNDEGLGKKFYRRLAWADCQKERAISTATLHWWTKQAGFADVMSDDDRVPFICGLSEYAEFVAGANEFWSKGNFDYVILENALRANNLPVYWHYGKIRDYRTMLKLANMAGVSELTENEHNALGDAVNQAELAVRYLREMKKLKEMRGGEL